MDEWSLHGPRTPSLPERAVVLLAISVGANVAQQSMSLGQGVLTSAIIGAVIFVGLVEPEQVLTEDDDD